MLRRATSADLPRLTELWMEMMRAHEALDPRIVLTPAAPSAYRSYLEFHLSSPKSVVVAAEKDDRLVGYCCAYMCQNLPMFAPAEFGYISDLAVTPAYQGQGVGTQLLQHVTDWFRRYGVRIVHLQVYSNNPEGRRFWEAKGFRPFVERHATDL